MASRDEDPSQRPTSSLNATKFLVRYPCYNRAAARGDRTEALWQNVSGEYHGMR
jgi:hypothetical protein